MSRNMDSNGSSHYNGSGNGNAPGLNKAPMSNDYHFVPESIGKSRGKSNSILFMIL